MKTETECLCRDAHASSGTACHRLCEYIKHEYRDRMSVEMTTRVVVQLVTGVCEYVNMNTETECLCRDDHQSSGTACHRVCEYIKHEYRDRMSVSR